MSKILVVDDEVFVADMVEATLSAEGYAVEKAYTGEDALAAVENDPPDLILLDLMLPGMDGYEVGRQLQRDARFSHIPVIMLTARSAAHERVAGYERGADDYITKPFDADELLIRVRAQLQHLNRGEKSELTGLPGSEAVEAAIEDYTLNADKPWTIIYIDIEHFTAFNEVYSFQQGNSLIKEAGQVLSQAVKDAGNETDFLGHVGGDDFVILTTPEKTQAISDKATALFKEVVPKYFNTTDQTNGYFISVNHSGETVQAPLLTFSYDVVDNHPEDDEG